MRNVPIEIFVLAQTKVDRIAVRRWLDYLGAGEYEIPNEESVSDPALLVALAAKRCYLSFQPGLNPNVTKVRKDLTEYIDNILKSGHGSVLEHAVYTFAIEGVSRVFTGEMNRHRAGCAISEGSMRYIRYEDIPWWLPTSIQFDPRTEEQLRGELDTAYWKLPIGEGCIRNPLKGMENPSAWIEPQIQEWKRIENKKCATRMLFNKHYTMTEEHYKEGCEIWEEELDPSSKFKGKKQVTSMLRRLIPMGVATGGVWSLNIRALRHILSMRATEAAEEEIYHVFSRCAEIMLKNEPMLLGDFKVDTEGFWSPKFWKV